MQEEKVVKATITLKQSVLENLDRFANEFGLSRSGMIAVLVQNRVREDEAIKMSKDLDQALKSIGNLTASDSKA